MFNKQNKNLNFKKVLATLWCFVLGLTCAGIFVNALSFFQTSKPNQEVAVTQPEKEEFSSAFTINWQKDVNKIQPLRVEGNFEEEANGERYYIVGIDETFTINGGTKITPQKNGNGVVLKLTGSTEEDIILHAYAGYEITKIEFAYYDSSSGKDVVVATWPSKGFTNITTEEMDPNYTGTLKFIVYTSTETYEANLYYGFDENGERITIDGALYMESASYGIDVDGWLYDEPSSCPEGKEFGGWWLDVTKALGIENINDIYYYDHLIDSYKIIYYDTTWDVYATFYRVEGVEPKTRRVSISDIDEDGYTCGELYSEEHVFYQIQSIGSLTTEETDNNGNTYTVKKSGDIDDCYGNDDDILKTTGGTEIVIPYISAYWIDSYNFKIHNAGLEIQEDGSIGYSAWADNMNEFLNLDEGNYKKVTGAFAYNQNSDDNSPTELSRTAWLGGITGSGSVDFNFMESKETAFYWASDYPSKGKVETIIDADKSTSNGKNAYYVFNLGYEIYGYKIKVAIDESADGGSDDEGFWNSSFEYSYYLNYSESKFIKSEDPDDGMYVMYDLSDVETNNDDENDEEDISLGKVIPIETIKENNLKFSDVVTFVSNGIDKPEGCEIIIKIIPIWKAVDLKPILSDGSTAIVKDEPFKFNTNGYKEFKTSGCGLEKLSSVGQSHYAYKAVDPNANEANGTLEHLISMHTSFYGDIKNEDGDTVGNYNWLYVDIPSACYDYLEDEKYYTLTVEPVFLDDIFYVGIENYYPALDPNKGTYYYQIKNDFSFADVRTKLGGSPACAIEYSSLLDFASAYISYGGVASLYDWLDILTTQATAYIDGIDGNGIDDNGDKIADFDCFNKVYYHSDSFESGEETLIKFKDGTSKYDTNFSLLQVCVANNQPLNLPIFEDVYDQVVAWQLGQYFDDEPFRYDYYDQIYKAEHYDAEGNVCGCPDDGVCKTVLNNISTDESHFVTSWSVPEDPCYGFVMKAHTISRVRMYYLDENNEYKYVYSPYFADGFTATTDTVTVNGVNVKGWYFDQPVFDDANYIYLDNYTTARPSYLNVTNDSTNKELKIYGAPNGYNSNYFDITSFTNSMKFVQDDKNPVIKARQPRNYEILIDNTEAEKEDEDIYNSWPDLGVKNTDFFGAYSYSSTGAAYTANIIVNYNSEYEFMSDNESAFFKYSDFWNDGGDLKTDYIVENGNTGYYYFVYNYGNHVTSWFIKASANGSTVYFVFDGSTLKYANVDRDSYGNAIATGADLGDLADVLDNYFDLSIRTVDVTLYPIWTAVEVIPEISGENQDEITFNAKDNIYNLGYVGAPSVGKSIMAYTYDTGKFVSNDGVWNYKEIPYDEYHYEYTGTYSIVLDPYYVDNIYRVNMVKPHSIQAGVYDPPSNLTYSLQSGDYTLFTDGHTADEYNFDNYVEKDVYSFVSYAESNKATFIDDYIIQLDGLIGSWNSYIECAGFSIFENLNYTNGTLNSNKLTCSAQDDPGFYIYLANDQVYKNLPVLENEYAKLIFWKDGKDVAYKTTAFDEDGDASSDLFSKEITEAGYGNPNTKSGNGLPVWKYQDDNSCSFEPKYVFSIRMYYENSAYEYDEDDYKAAEWYGKYTEVSLVDVNGDYLEKYKVTSNGPAGYVFNSWVYDADAGSDFSLLANGYTDENKILTVGGDTGELTLTCSAKNKYITQDFGDLYYITKIKGDLFLNQVDAGALHAIIKAKWSKLYDLTLDNSNTYWEQNGESESFGAFARYTDVQSQVQSAGGAGVAKVDFQIANHDDYKYPFMTSVAVYTDGNGDEIKTPMSFFKAGDFGDNSGNYVAKIGENYYYTYSYGFHITGWQMYSEANNVSFVKENGEWSIVEGIVTTDITQLVGKDNFTSLAKLAENADEYFVLQTGEIKLTITPVWEEVKVTVYEASAGSYLVEGQKFAESYVLDSDVSVRPSGKELFAYEYDSGALIAVNGVWNYRNIQQDKFEYEPITEVDGIPGSGIYTLDVSPIFVDNLYKVSLTNITTFEGRTYQLTNGCDYSFNAAMGGYLNSSAEVLAYDDYAGLGGSDYEFYLYQHYAGDKVLVEDYVENGLKVYLEDWNEKIQGTLNILRKVYYSANATVKGSGKSLEIGATVPNFHIYLANGQDTGNLPVFEKDDYALIFWENVPHENWDGVTDSNSNGVPDCCENDENSNCAKLNHKHFIYATKEYNSADHLEELKNADGSFKYAFHTDGNGVFENIWYLTDGNYSQSGKVDRQIKLVAHHYRKNYLLDIETYLGADIARAGYVHVYIQDDLYWNDATVNGDNHTIKNTGGNYIVIAESGEMKIYKLNEGASRNNTIVGKIAFNSISHYLDLNNNKLNPKYLVNELPLYAGCSVTMNVYDQGKDALAMSTGLFDEMIGHKRSDDEITGTVSVNGVVDSSKEILFSGSYYTYFIAKEDVTAMQYANKSIISMSVYFEKIAYKLKFAVNSITGDFDLEAANDVINNKTSHELTNVMVGNTYKVKYAALAGFTMVEDGAFTLDYPGKSFNLQNYNDSNVNNTLVNQEHSVQMATSSNFDGTWLRNYLYCTYTDYNVNQIDIGVININTCPIEFSYGVKIYDSTCLSNDGIIETLEDFTTFALKDVSNLPASTAKIDPISTYLTLYQDAEIGDILVYQSQTTGKLYALRASKLYYPNFAITNTADNHYTQYKFLTTSSEVSVTKELSPSYIARMVQNFETEEIIKCNDRKIYILLEVRELFTVTMNVKVLDGDTNSTNRKTTITSSDNDGINSKTFNIVSGEAINMDRYIANNDLTTRTVKIYSYNGLNNLLTSNFVENYYRNAEYYLNNSIEPLKTNSFVSTGNDTLTVVYVPEPIQIKYVYKLNGVKVDSSEIATYIKEGAHNPTETDLFYIFDEFTYAVECVQEDYNVEFKINGLSGGITNNTDRSLEYTYTVTYGDFSKGYIEIVVEAKLKDSAQISITYQVDNQTAFDTSNCGTFSVYGSTAPVEDVKSATVGVLSGKTVKLKIDVPIGYIFKGIIYPNSENPTSMTLDANGEVTLISSFNSQTDLGAYKIALGKSVVSANMNVTGLKSKYYINGVTSGTIINVGGLSIGKTITLMVQESKEERLDYFYYSSNNGVVKLSSNEILITSNLLDSIGDFSFDFGVAVVNRYYYNLQIEDPNGYLLEDSVKVSKVTDDNDFIVTDYGIDMYFDEGTRIAVEAKSDVEGKYIITYNGNSYEVLNREDEIITLTANTVKTLSISPKVFDVEVLEYLYSNLTQIDGRENPTLEIANPANGINVAGQTYNTQTSIVFNLSNSSREICALYITGNDSTETLIVEFGAALKAYKILEDGVTKEPINLSDYGYSIVTSATTATLTYTTFNDVTLRLDYKIYKEIKS